MNISFTSPAMHAALLALVTQNAFGIGSASSPQRPNIVFIYADDMGYSDLSCYGQTRWTTPNLDALAENGVRFTDFYSASPISSPSRAALLTGRYPNRMGIRGVFFPDSFTGMPQEEVTIAEVLKEEGYATGMIGKWHLGHLEKYLPLQQGFDEYFGIPYSNDMASQVYLRGNEVEQFHVDQRMTTQTYTKEALKFIDTHKGGPFFLYLAYNMVHVPIYVSPEFEGRSGAGLYGDAVLEMDWSVGSIISALREAGIEDNTLVVFSSDNGPWLQEGPYGGCAYPLKEGKGTDYEGGVRVPCIASWKSHIPSSVNSEPACMLDWMPTFSTLCGASLPDVKLDGFDISGVLLGSGERASDEYAYFYDNQELTAFRKGDWKLELPHDGVKGNFWRRSVSPRDTVLVNLRQDVGETVNRYYSDPDVAASMVARVNEYKSSYGPVPPPLVNSGNNQRNALARAREAAIERALLDGEISLECETVGFMLPEQVEDFVAVERDSIIYRFAGTEPLHMIVYRPADWRRREGMSAMVFFFGGGWNSGSPGQFAPQAVELAKRGMSVFLPDYRVKNRQGTDPFAALSDAKSAMRFVRGHASEFRLDPEKIAAGGGSAGGHLAAACACIEGSDNYGDDLRISAVPSALVLFNPVIDNSPEGYGYERFGDDYVKISPMHNVKPGFPPTIIMTGSGDNLVTVPTIRGFQGKIELSGGRCRVEVYPDQEHGFFNKGKNSDIYYHKTVSAMLDFLKKENYL